MLRYASVTNEYKCASDTTSIIRARLERYRCALIIVRDRALLFARSNHFADPPFFFFFTPSEIVFILRDSTGFSSRC